MNSFIARQPIFDIGLETIGYELLYRNAENQGKAEFVDGSKATSFLMSDAMFVFGLSKLTDEKPAFINFTDQLIMTDLAYSADPNEIVIEILETIEVTDEIIQKVIELKDKGYRLALDDYVGSEEFARLLPYVDILKVDFMLTDKEQQVELGKLREKYPQMMLLAEKIETQEDFDWAKKLGYKFFQGYFFEKPMTVKKKIPKISLVTYGNLLREINAEDGIDFEKCAKIITQDAVLHYRILQKINTMNYYRGNNITDVERSIVLMGENGFRQFILLLLARDNNVTCSDELVKKAYVRACFLKKMAMMIAKDINGEYAFQIGIFSLLDRILGLSMEEVLESISLPKEIENALLRSGNSVYRKLLDFVCLFENVNNNNRDNKNYSEIVVEKITNLYMSSIAETDKAFKE